MDRPRGQGGHEVFRHHHETPRRFRALGLGGFQIRHRRHAFRWNGRDPLGELAKACRKHGVKLGFYYSHWLDWEHPGGARPPWPERSGDPQIVQPSDADFAKYWEGKCLPQVTELIERYKPDMFWFDSWGGRPRDQVTPARRDQLIKLIRDKAPGCMINGRIASYDPAGADFVSMGDNEFPDAANAPKVPWETPGTMNHSWGYNRLDFQWKSFDQLLDTLINNAHHGGAITLNVGPMGNGSFQQAAKRRLQQFAAWIHQRVSLAAHRAQSIPGRQPARWHPRHPRSRSGEALLQSDPAQAAPGWRPRHPAAAAR